MDPFTILAKRLKERLTETHSNCETKIKTEGGVNYFVIVNPSGGDDIRISCTDGEGINLSFASQGAHFGFCAENIDDNVDALMGYINDYLCEKKVFIEFFHEETTLFCGEAYLNDLDASSGKSLLKSFVNDTALYEILYKKIKGLNCRCSIRAWDAANNKDMDFVL
ncbi:MAG: hypothetical protein FWD39_01315 [Clostridiales bacterium]|nr:hypothetical protein [Clostridiales bacterium]